MSLPHLLLVGVPLLSFVGLLGYRHVAEHFGIVAVPNERTLHTGNIPRGAGVVIVVVFLSAVATLFGTGGMRLEDFLALFAGGAVIAAVGFVDDIVNLGSRLRFGIHIGLSVWALYWLGGMPPIDLGFGAVDLGWTGHLLAGLAGVWMINLFNFMDGVDGMETAGVVAFCACAAALLFLTDAPDSALLIALLGLATAPFLRFNWPPARMFLGDSGSGFFGYAFAVLVVMTMARGELSLWTWAIILGYFISDTTTTTVLRILKVPKWYGTHRSHAYQNLARVWDNHRRITGLVVLINVLWLWPLAALSVYFPAYGMVLALVAVAPPVGFACKYGPLFSET